MGTLVTTRKMSPALAARVEASVRGRRGVRGRPARALVIVSARAAALALVVATVLSVVAHRRRSARELEAARSLLLLRVETESASVTASDLGIASRVESWLLRANAPYEGDFIADPLRAPGMLAAFLGREALYARVPAGALHDAASLRDATRASYEDALLLCLVDPPESHAEKALAAKARAALEGPALAEHRANLHRLYDAEAGLPLLLPGWAERARAARGMQEIDALRTQWDGAPVHEATRALKARVLISAVDEPGDGPGPTELDGERAHDVRVELVDLSSDAVVLRLRKHVDPAAISALTRTMYATGIDGCAAAVGILESAGRPRAEVGLAGKK